MSVRYASEWVEHPLLPSLFTILKHENLLPLIVNPRDRPSSNNKDQLTRSTQEASGDVLYSSVFNVALDTPPPDFTSS